MTGAPTREEMAKQIADLQKELAVLRRERAELADIFFLSVDMICVADINTSTFIKVNPAFTRALGYAESELLDRPFIEFIHPDDIDATISVVKEKLRAGMEVVNFINRYRCKDGSYRWLEWVSQPMPERGVTFSVAHDITVRKEAESALKDSETFVRAVMDNLPIGIAVNAVDPTVSFHYMNDNFPRFYRTTKESISVPDAFWESVYEDPEYREKIRKRVLEDCASGDPKRMYWEDIPVTRKGKDTAFITAMNTPIPEKGLMISTVWDVTERKRAESALIETKRLLEETQAITRLGGWEYDVDRVHLTWTDEVFRIYGIDPQDRNVDLTTALRYYAPEDLPRIEAAFRQAVEEGESYDLELRLNRADGDVIWVRTMGRPVMKDGRVIRITGNIVDITERKKDQAERERLQDQLLQAQKMESVGRLAGGVAHDFNNMLGVIIGNTEMALDQVATDHPVHADLEEIQKAALRSANLTQQLLAFARKQTVAPKVLDLNAVLSGMLKMLRRLIGENIDLDWIPGKGLWPVKMDPGQVDQILANLCVNARDAIAEVGRVVIEADNVSFAPEDCDHLLETRPGDFVRIAVSDNGCGMEREVVTRLFEPFFTTKGAGEGTGLGLATVYGIVKQNQGFINVYSEPGKGSTFRIYLPRYMGASKAQQYAEIAAHPSAPSQATVLLVEDEPAILNMCQKMLQRLGYGVLPAGTPGEAIARAEAHAGEIHLLMTDVIMPEMNGRDLARRLLTLYPNMKRLFMSGYTADVIAHHGVLEEGVQFIQKPFSQKDLAAGVRCALES